MGGGEKGPMILKRTKVSINDASRGLFLNRGVYISAPPGFFQSYPSDFEAPMYGYEKLNVHVRTIDEWDPRSGFLAKPVPKMEIPAPAPTPIAETVISSEQTVSEPVAQAPKAMSTKKSSAVKRRAAQIK